MLVEGEYYESLGQQEQAASVYHALFELFPDNLDYGLRLVAAQTLSSHGSQAMEVIHQLRRLPPPSSDDPRIDLAEKRAMKSNNPAELALVRSAIRKASDRGQKLIYALARKEECTILNYSEHPDQALSCLRRRLQRISSCREQVSCRRCAAQHRRHIRHVGKVPAGD